ncbi:hypothetical protein KX928_08105 [Roseobacter sp. YSTF-M11]|uniref:CENP-V/GFA domain-containing protein n=1 Tax=Roseobacter insulae TaxID=2859783 RepID=A0A9X1FU72_9RHOB|nr:DUF6151 family protein [Roseobacter insulae]MBW4707748.1 hypothetical protein [Roseobacter insulae]
MSSEVSFSCQCGTLKGVLHDVAPASGCHLICYCKDCRAFARHMGQMEALEPGGGSPLVQVLPNRIEITQGADQIACLRLSPKGLYRWYATCCRTPLANTVGTSKMPLAGMWRPNFADTEALGPVVTHGFTKFALPVTGAPRKDKGLARMLGGLLKRTLAAYLSGTARISPFFDQAGQPVAEPRIISLAEREAAYRE